MNNQPYELSIWRDVPNSTGIGYFEDEKVSYAELKKSFDAIVEKNGGYSYGNNFGVKHLGDEYDNIIISNPDVSVEEKAIIDSIKKYKEISNKIGAEVIRGTKDTGMEGVVREFTKKVNDLVDRPLQDYTFTEDMARAMLSGDEETLQDLLAEPEKQTDLAKGTWLQKMLWKMLGYAEDDSHTTEDIRALFGEYSAKYQALSAQEQEYLLMATEANIRALNNNADATAFYNLPLESQAIGLRWTAGIQGEMDEENFAKLYDANATAENILKVGGAITAAITAGCAVIGFKLGGFYGAIGGAILGLVAGIGTTVYTAVKTVENVEHNVKKLYAEYFEKCGSHKAHELLHTHYVERPKYSEEK